MEIHENLFQSTGSEYESVPGPAKFDTFQPLNDLVLVKRYQEDNSKAGSFIVPEKFRQQSNRGIVVAVNLQHNGIKAGDRVTFGVYNAETILIDGEEMLLIRWNDIRGVERA